MERLKGKFILIGKEPNGTRLSVTLVDGEKHGTAIIGVPGSVPASVSRNKHDGLTAHAKLAIDTSGNIVLTNLKPQNVTYVNGSEIESKRINPDAELALGMDRYIVDLNDVMRAARMIASKMAQKVAQSEEIFSPGVHQSNPSTPNNQGQANTYNIRHLARVWDTYHNGLKQIQEDQKKKQLFQRFPMFFTFGSGGLTAVAAALEWGSWVKIVCLCLTLIGILMMVVSFYIAKKDDSIEKREQLTEDFQDNYCCPNPDCNRFLGTQSFKMLKKQTGMKCPYCKSKYIEA